MSTVSKLQIHSTDSALTEKLGNSIGSKLKGGEVIELVSDLGGGKTTFTRGLVSGAGSHDHVSSPTFTISNIYQTPSLQIHHFDLYRLPELGFLANEIAELQQDNNNVLILEWAGLASGVLPNNRLTIKFITTSETQREIELSYPKQLNYLIKDIN